MKGNSCHEHFFFFMRQALHSAGCSDLTAGLPPGERGYDRMARHASPARGAIVLAALVAVCCAVLVAVAVSGRGKAVQRQQLLSLPLPLEPAAHPRLRAIAHVPRSHGYTDAVDFGALPTASSRVVRGDVGSLRASPAPRQEWPERRGVSSAAASRCACPIRARGLRPAALRAGDEQARRLFGGGQEATRARPREAPSAGLWLLNQRLGVFYSLRTWRHCCVRTGRDVVVKAGAPRAGAPCVVLHCCIYFLPSWRCSAEEGRGGGEGSKAYSRLAQ